LLLIYIFSILFIVIVNLLPGVLSMTRQQEGKLFYGGYEFSI